MEILSNLLRPESEVPLCPKNNTNYTNFTKDRNKARKTHGKFVKDWIFSKSNASGVKRGMPRSKNGRTSMGGKDEQKKDRNSSSPRPISHDPTTDKTLILEKSSVGVKSPKGGLNVPSTTAAEGGEDNGSSSGSSASSTPARPGVVGRKKKRHQRRLHHASTTDTEENGSDISSTLEREAPDGGWGWIVVGAAFFVNLIADGVTFSFGVFYTELSERFGESKATTAWVGSLLAAMPLLSGPIASSLTDRFGCRKVTICGGLLAALGFLLSSFANSIHMLMLTFGVITGFGLSLCYVAAVVIVAYYFERRRSFATGLSVCGGGIGTFIFAPLTQYLIKEFGWRGTTRILSGVFLNLCVCGILMKDLEWTKKTSRKRDKLLQNEHDFNTQAQQKLLTNREIGPQFQEGKGSMALKNERLCNSALCIPTFVQEQERRGSRRIRYFSNNYGNSMNSGDEGDLKKSSRKASTNSNRNLTQEETEKDKVETKDGSPSHTGTATVNGGIIVSNSNSNSCSPQPNSANLISFNTNNIIKTHSNNCNSNNNLNHASAIVTNNESNGTAVTGTEPTAQQKQQAMRNYVVHHTRNWSGRHRHSLTYRGAVVSLKRYRLRPASSCPDIISVATTDDRSAHEWKAALADIYIWMRGIFAWENLANTRFLLFIMSNFLLYMWYDIPYIFLSDSAIENGYTKDQGAYLGSTIGICNVFGNIILGYIGDKKWANSIMVYGICISICGGVTALMPYFITLNYYLLSVLSGFFGVMIAANYSLTSVILVKVVSLERFANAYGLLLLVQGIGNLIGPPIAGVLYDWTGTYSWSFLVAGGGIFVSNFFILAPIYNQSGPEEEKTESDERDDSAA